MPIEDRRICIGTTKKGTPCTQMALTNSEYCKLHDPNFEGPIGQPRKHGYYATVISDEDELNAYMEALSMSRIERLYDMASFIQAKSRILNRADLDEIQKLDLLQRLTDSARRCNESAGNLEVRSKVSDSIKQISFLWEDEEKPSQEPIEEVKDESESNPNTVSESKT